MPRGAYGRAHACLRSSPGLPQRTGRREHLGPGTGMPAIRRPTPRGCAAPGASADPGVHRAGRHDGRPDRHRPPDEHATLPCVMCPCLAVAAALRPGPAASPARHPPGHGQCAGRPTAAVAAQTRRPDPHCHERGAPADERRPRDRHPGARAGAQHHAARPTRRGAGRRWLQRPPGLQAAAHTCRGEAFAARAELACSPAAAGA